MADAVSVVIPTLNAGPEFRATLDGIRRQRIDRPVEIVVVDSGSTDGTLDLCREFDVQAIPRAGAFNHGATRNQAIAASHGAFVALTVQDAVPLDDQWLAGLLEPLETDATIAGSYSRQIARPDCRPFTRKLLADHVTGSIVPHVQRLPAPEIVPTLRPLPRMRLCIFDNVSSCVRRSVWEQSPFPAAQFGEDLEWAYAALRLGYGIAYAPRSAVIHSHDRSAWYELKRSYATHKLARRMFGYVALPHAKAIWPNARHQIRQRLSLEPRRTLAATLDATAHSFGGLIGQYLGGQAAKLGRRIDAVLCRGV